MNVDGTATVLAAAREAGVRRVVYDLVDRGVRRAEGAPDRRGRPARRRRRLRRVEDRGGAAVALEFARRGLETVIVRPKTFVGPERLGVFEILFDWIREGRRIYVLGRRCEPLPAPRGRGSRRGDRPRVDGRRRGEAFNVGAAEFGTVREDLGALIAHAGSASRLTPGAGTPAELALRALELAPRSRRSPSGTTRRRTATRSSTIDEGARLLGWEPRHSNEETLCATYDWYLAHRERLGPTGTTHRVPWNQGALGLLRRLS